MKYAPGFLGKLERSFDNMNPDVQDRCLKTFSREKLLRMASAPECHTIGSMEVFDPKHDVANFVTELNRVPPSEKVAICYIVNQPTRLSILKGNIRRLRNEFDNRVHDSDIFVVRDREQADRFGDISGVKYVDSYETFLLDPLNQIIPNFSISAGSGLAYKAVLPHVQDKEFVLFIEDWATEGTIEMVNCSYPETHRTRVFVTSAPTRNEVDERPLALWEENKKKIVELERIPDSIDISKIEGRHMYTGMSIVPVRTLNNVPGFDIRWHRKQVKSFVLNSLRITYQCYHHQLFEHIEDVDFVNT